MGQTQILMIVLAVIIVGIAVAAGIQMFGKSSVSANKDAVVGDCQNIIVLAQQYYKKPTQLGGGGSSFKPGGANVTLAMLNFSGDAVAGGGINNLNGTYTLTVNDEKKITVVGTGNENTASTPVIVTMTYDAATGATTTTFAQ